MWTIKKENVVDKLLIHNFMKLIQSDDISQDIWEKSFLLSIICVTSSVAFPFAILCGLLFVISTTDYVEKTFSTSK